MQHLLNLEADELPSEEMPSCCSNSWQPVPFEADADIHSSKNSNCQIVAVQANPAVAANPGVAAHANELVQVEEIKQHPITNLLNAAAQKVVKVKKKTRTLVLVKKPVAAAANFQIQQRASERSASESIINPETGS